MEGKVCRKCGVWKPLEEYHKGKRYKDGRRSYCKECMKGYGKIYRENNKEHMKELYKQWYQENKEHREEYNKQWYQSNKEYHKEYHENNKEHIKEICKQRYQANKEYHKECRENNRKNNLQYIADMLEQINPIFKKLNLPVYGYIYKFENVRTGKVYIGQTINPLSRRYNGSNIIRGWIKDRLKYNGQKFTEELIEEDFIVTETLDVAFCQYHLDKLESYWISYYDSCNNGYNNNIGHHNTDDYIEEFNQILLENNLEFIDGKLVKIA